MAKPLLFSLPGYVLAAGALLAQAGPANMNSPSGTQMGDLNLVGFTSLTVYGTVLLASGSAPGQLVLIERVCNGVRQTGGFTDSKGRFSFDIGPLNKSLQDSGTSDRLSTDQASAKSIRIEELQICKAQATLPGYRSDSVPMWKGTVQNTNLGSIVLQPIGKEQSPARSATDEQAPKNARKAYEKGLDAAAKAKWAEAIEAFTKATAIYPQYASAWLSMGILQAATGGAELAEKSFAQAIAADGGFALPYLHAAEVEAAAGQWQTAADHAAHVIQADPDSFPRAYVLSALANLNLRRYDAALENATKGLQLDTAHRFPELEFASGIALLSKKDWPGASQHLKAYLALAPNGPDAHSAKQQLAGLPGAK